MAEFKQVMRAFNRMCYDELCEYCPFHDEENGDICQKTIHTEKEIEDIERIVLNWEKGHPEGGKSCSNCYYSEVPSYKSPCRDCDMISKGKEPTIFWEAKVMKK